MRLKVGEAMEKLEGVVADIVYQSDDMMYSVLRVENKVLGKYTVVYHGPAPYLGEHVSVEGDWIEHARFGQQFNAATLQVMQPTSAAGMERFLASGALPGV